MKVSAVKPLTLLAALALTGCPSPEPTPPVDGHGPIAANISAPLGEPLPNITDTQLATFERGRTVSLKRFDRDEGLGPAFNVTFCSSCHERPTPGGSAGLYRNFFLSGVRTDQGAFFPGESAGDAGGVIRLYGYGELPARISVPTETNVFTQRNPIPFFGVGLLAAVSDEEILSRADPDDLNGDGVSGRANFDRGFVGRFGRKSQTVSIEGFIRGPLFNHLGVTSDPLDNDQRSRLPVDSSDREGGQALRLAEHAQAAAPDGPLVDDDGVADPELSTDDLFDLVSFAMLLAAPAVEPLTEVTRRGGRVFDNLRCGACHTPRINSPTGPLPVYSDLLIHDMGEALADGLEMGEASGREFRTQPLWGLAAVGPYLHDGRATTIAEAIGWHAGEAQASKEAFEALGAQERDDLLEFLLSLGGRDQFSPGLIPPDKTTPSATEYGGPYRPLSGSEQTAFNEGQAVFDRDFGFADGVGGPRYNGDSCRACHFEPVVGGAGPRGVNVTRHGTITDGVFSAPDVGTILHRLTTLEATSIQPQEGTNVFEHRQTPPIFGLGLVEAIPEETITANADPDDNDGDGISGRVSRTSDGRLGRFGWKAQVPSIREFVRDAVAAELGMTIAAQEGLTFGATDDGDDVPDPEFSLQDASSLADYMLLLGPPPRGEIQDAGLVAQGEALFEEVGCAKCHIPSLEGPDGPVNLYSDILLHEILPADTPGIVDTAASMLEFRTPPLWGIRDSAPYMHHGEADTLEQSILQHAGEGNNSRENYLALDQAGRSALIAFLETL